MGQKSKFSVQEKEKIEAIKYYIENNRNYSKLSEIFNVSYQQIYLLVKNIFKRKFRCSRY